MKMTTKIMAVLLTVISTVTFAKPNDSTKRDAHVRVIAGSTNGSYKLVYSGDEGRVKMKLLNKSGQVLHDERLNTKTGFIQPFDFSYLPSGDYTFMVDNGRDTFVEAVSYSTSADQLSKKISFEQVGNQVEFRGKELDSAKLRIYIYNDGDQLVYSEAIQVEKIDQIYNLVNLQSDWVNFVVVNDDAVIASKRFSLK